MADLTVALFQAEAREESAEEKLERAGAAAAQAVEKGAELLLFPELFQSGYNSAGEIRRRAEPFDGPFAGAMAGISERYGIALAYGYAEAAEGRLYNSCLCLGPDGVLLANHRKLVLPSDYEKSYFKPHAGLTLFDYRGWRIAVLVCYDIEFPENARACAQAGAELLLVPTALHRRWDVVAEKLIPTRAFENGVFLAYANYAGEERGLPYFGGSRLVGPWGRELATAGKGEELLLATLRKEDLQEARQRLPYLPDVTTIRY